MNAKTEVRPPANDYTARLAPMFADVLLLDEVGPDENFFDLDGDSLTAVRLVTMISAEFGVTVTIGEFFSEPTMAGVADLLAAASPATAEESPREVARPATVPLSPAQEGIWFTSALSGWSGLYNLPVAVRLEGAVDRPALAAALRDLVARHEVLRTRFPESGGAPRQEVLTPGAAFTGLHELACRAEDLPALFEEDFDVTTDAPLRAYLVDTGDDGHHLVVLLHHIACDGGSMVQFVRELDTAYTARLRGRAPQWPEPATQYADYTVWQRRSLAATEDAARAFWRDTLRGAPDTLALPSARPRPEVASGEGASVALALPLAVHTAALDLARSANATLFMVAQAAFAVALSRAGAGRDIVLGTPVSGRAHTDLEAAIGLFVNLVALRTDLSGELTFRELLARVRAADTAAYNHADLPFQKVVEAVAPRRRTAVHPVVQATMTVDGDLVGRVPLPGLAGQAKLPAIRVAKFDLGLLLETRRDEDGSPAGLSGRLEYSTDLFDADTAQTLATTFVESLTHAVTTPDARLALPSDR